MDYVREQAEKKGKSASEWLTAVAVNAKKCRLATHIGKFTNPDIATNIQAAGRDGVDEMLVSTYTVDCAIDAAAGSAAYLPVAKLLIWTPAGETETLYEKLQREGADYLRRELPGLDIDYDGVCGELLQVQAHVKPESSDERLRQVYFPVGDDYHLLTVMPPSCVMVELSNRLQEKRAARRAARDVKSEGYGSNYEQWSGLTEISIGGSKPQNISVKNNDVHGSFPLLASLPPHLDRREVRRPKRDFFAETLWRREFDGLFLALHHDVYTRDWNNKAIRNHARRLEQEIIDRVLLKVYALRQIEPGWSDGEEYQLERSQKIWLDQQYQGARLEDDTWLTQIAKQFSRWMLVSYEKQLKDAKVMLGDGELAALRQEITDVLAKDLHSEEGGQL